MYIHDNYFILHGIDLLNHSSGTGYSKTYMLIESLYIYTHVHT